MYRHQRLQPVALDHALEGEGVARRRNEAIEVRESGRLATAEICEQDAALLDDRVRGLADVLAEAAALGLSGGVDALPGDVEEPAVEQASQTLPRGSLRLTVTATGVNYVDGLIVQGLYQIKPPVPFVPGNEVAGVVSEVGEGVTGWAVA
mgnify:CR=1 FL=1